MVKSSTTLKAWRQWHRFCLFVVLTSLCSLYPGLVNGAFHTPSTILFKKHTKPCTKNRDGGLFGNNGRINKCNDEQRQSLLYARMPPKSSLFHRTQNMLLKKPTTTTKIQQSLFGASYAYLRNQWSSSNFQNIRFFATVLVATLALIPLFKKEQKEKLMTRLRESIPKIESSNDEEEKRPFLIMQRDIFQIPLTAVNRNVLYRLLKWILLESRVGTKRQADMNGKTMDQWKVIQPLPSSSSSNDDDDAWELPFQMEYLPARDKVWIYPDPGYKTIVKSIIFQIRIATDLYKMGKQHTSSHCISIERKMRIGPMVKEEEDEYNALSPAGKEMNTYSHELYEEREMVMVFHILRALKIFNRLDSKAVVDNFFKGKMHADDYRGTPLFELEDPSIVLKAMTAIVNRYPQHDDEFF